MSVGLVNQTLTQFGKDTTGEVTYTFNQQGFRSDQDFNFVPDYAFFGCSLVFGIGVPVEQTFAKLFANSQNYGLAGNYNNHDVFVTINSYLKSNTYSPSTKLAVFWTDRDADRLDNYYHLLKDHNIKHFFCSTPLPYDNCYPVPANLDFDVSGTHMGPKTHKFIWKILCQLLNDQ
jgi:hypothetical protein